MSSKSNASIERMAKNLAAKKSETVRVIVRVRPISQREKDQGRRRVVDVDREACTVRVTNPSADSREPPRSFTFDNVYGPGSEQKTIYDETAAPIVEAAMQGYNGTIFAYGQTGAGKTHTMEGYPDPPEMRGIIPNTFRHIFQAISMNQTEGKRFLVRASYLEIYNEEIRDLLGKDPKHRLDLKENADSGVYVKDLTSFVVKGVNEIDQVMQAGKKNRSVGSTNMNATSSRSHSIFTITVETSTLEADGEAHIRVGKLNMVDLAGSERQAKTGATGQRLKEATKINLSLSALGNVISALVDAKSQHIPYRDSKLTRLLQDSLGGNTKTVMCANCGPAGYNYDETLSTLRYANRAKNIKNKPRINEDPKDAMLREFQEEIERLKRQLAEQGGGGGGAPSGGSFAGAGQKIVEKVVVKEVGISEEKLKEMEDKARKEKDEIKRQAEAEVERLRAAQKLGDAERRQLEEQMIADRQEREQMLKARHDLQAKLSQMQEKLLEGGKMMSKAAQQEYELRQAQIELEERRRQEMELAKELEEREEANLLVEEQFASLQEEVDVKTRKLKKLFQKFKNQKLRLQDQEEEFGRERADMLDAIRDLSRQQKLKQLVIDNFIPPDVVEMLHRRATWDEENDEWVIPRLDLVGNTVRGRRPVSATGLRRPETDYAKHRKKFDKNPRYRSENIANLELDMPERTTEDYEGPAMSQRVQAALNAALLGDDNDEVEFDSPENLPEFNPYLNYAGDESSSRERSRDRDRERRSSRPKSSMRRRQKSRSGKRPGTAGRHGRGSRKEREVPREDDEFSAVMYAREEQERDLQEQYPEARGLVGR